MDEIPFCPRPECPNHFEPVAANWYRKDGFHLTKAFGLVPRFRCLACGKTFSTQTFSIDYYAKRVVDYRDLLTRHANSESVRGIGRALELSCGTVLNRFDRLARQAAALHADLRTRARSGEDICVDGFVSFDVSQFFPNEITMSISADSLFILDLSHATRKRSGTMTKQQKLRAAALYPRVRFEHGAIGRTFRDILHSLVAERPITARCPLVIITDEKKEYVDVLRRSKAWQEQDETHRIVHRRINSKLPRSFLNPLFPSNYLDREVRKDQANHHRESTCFSRNVANAMSRLLCYIVHHNYRKRFRIKARVDENEVHAQVAGVNGHLLEHWLEEMFSVRAFLTRIRLPPTLARIWRKEFRTPLKEKTEYLPAFAFG